MDRLVSGLDNSLDLKGMGMTPIQEQTEQLSSVCQGGIAEPPGIFSLTPASSQYERRTSRRAKTEGL